MMQQAVLLLQQLAQGALAQVAGLLAQFPVQGAATLPGLAPQDFICLRAEGGRKRHGDAPGGCRSVRQRLRRATAAVASCAWRSAHYGGRLLGQRVGTSAMLLGTLFAWIQDETK